MRFLGIDYGTKRIGLAISDENGKIAFPKEILPNDFHVFDRLGVLIKKENHEKNMHKSSGECDIITKNLSVIRSLLPKIKEE